jgi:hypothetical protein
VFVFNAKQHQDRKFSRAATNREINLAKGIIKDEVYFCWLLDSNLKPKVWGSD